MSERRERRVQLGDGAGRLRRMVEIRLVEEAIQRLYSDGHVRGSTHLCNGQEAVSVGVAAALRPSDTVTCTYRGHGLALALGLTPVEVIGEVCGRAVGCADGIGGSMHLVGRDVGLMPTFAIVGAGVPVAAGAALTAQTLGTSDVAVAVFGDGASNIGAVHETMNLASVWRLPLILVIENNLYGEYSPLASTTSVTDLVRRADAYGLPGEIVDGQIVDEVMDAVSRAAERARGGGGPTVLEMKTYRYSGHSRSDPAAYRPDGELDAWRQRDPIFLAGSAVGATESQRLSEAAARDVSAAVDAVLAAPPPRLSAMWEHVSAGI